jgi:mono/diheme cytochrome c family protein
LDRIVFLLLAGATLALTQGWEVPDPERTKKNPVEATPKAVEKGRALFEKQCVMCHGKDMKAQCPAAAMFQVQPPDLSTSEARARLTDGEVFFKITVGKNPMPAKKSKLSEEERWKGVLYLRNLRAD